MRAGAWRICVIAAVLPHAAAGASSFTSDGQQPREAGPVFSILHDRPSCLAPEQHAVLEVELAPAPRAQLDVSVAFRREGSLYWYRVAMRPVNGRFIAELPRPRPGRRRIEYVVVAVAPEAPTTQSPPFVVPVEPECPAAAAAGPQRLVEVAREPNAPELPSGFMEESVRSSVDYLTRIGPQPRAEPEAASAPMPPFDLPIPSDRIRLLTRDGLAAGRPPLVGTLLRMNDRELVVRPDGASDTAVVPRATLAMLQFSERTPRGRNVLLGSVIGGALAFWTGARPSGRYQGWSIGWGGVLTPVGAAAGALVGSLVPRNDSWRDVPNPSAPRPGLSAEGVRVGLTWRF